MNSTRSITLDKLKERALIALHGRLSDSIAMQDLVTGNFLELHEICKASGDPESTVSELVTALPNILLAQGKKVIERLDVRCIGQLVDKFPEIAPPGHTRSAIQAEIDEKDRWVVTFDKSSQRQASVAPLSELALPGASTSWSAVKTILEQHLQARREQRREARRVLFEESEALPPAWVYSPPEMTELLLRTWMTDAPGEAGQFTWRGPLFLTATVSHKGLFLYTQPAKVQERPAPFMPYEEKDGVLVKWVDLNGQTRQPTRPLIASTDGHDSGVYSFSDFAEKVACYVSPSSWAQADDDQPTSAPAP